ncbi:related to ATP-dependent RNA helicase [Cephalotrichum gorgonifer]|uniref:RNA helicase n=1 Tax=Cephalotrichum gorgonifer TaxID=2041049 RepID=A0AAE8N044_9PEZI|nr:related to ATP-dependent RNA helicase [Cephalotrichum gorgonifer]
MGDFDINSVFIPALYKPAGLLPIAKHEREIQYLVETHQVLVVVGQTGSGKTTQIPQYLEKAGWCSEGQMIGITQPRRVAATTIAMRVAEEVGCEVGKEVGYSVRFEDATSASTRIKFLTDGLLIREAMMNPLLTQYSVIMVDEAHERSISTDILLGLLKKILKRRPDLRVIISSATIQAEHFIKFFAVPQLPGDGGPSTKEDEEKEVVTLSVQGRSYPIDILYLEAPTEDYVQRAVKTVVDIHSREQDGDILVFLTGREEIDDALEAVREQVDGLGEQKQLLLPLPLYAGLTTEQQMYIFQETPANTRKVVFATNIAEASVTIDGIVYVVDCGFVKIRAYNPKTAIDSLVVTPTSKASAAQRAGRAGRTKPGKCFRLYTKGDYDELPEANTPEMQRSNLAPIVLQLKALGIDNVLRFDYLSAPPSEIMVKALELLYSLGALDEDGKLTTPLGKRMAELALEPMMAKALLSAPSFGCLSEMLTIAAMTSLGGNVWFHHEGERKKMEESRAKFAADEGDHLTLLNAYQAFMTVGKQGSKFCHENHLNYKSMDRAVSIRAQLKRYLQRLDMRVDEPASGVKMDNGRDPARAGEQIRRCLTTGFFAHAAKMQPDGTFLSAGGDVVLHAHPNSVMFTRKAEWVIFHEILETSKKIFIRDVTKVERSWLLEYAPGYYQVTDNKGR